MGRIVAYTLRVDGVDVAIRSANELKEVQRQLNREFANAKFGTERYEELRREQAAAAVATKRLRDDQRLARNEIIASGKAAGIAAGSYRALEARLRVLDDEYKRLGNEAADAARKLDIRRQTSAIRKELKDIDARMGVYVRNVGNYASAWRGLGNTILALSGINVVSQGLNEIVRANSEISDSIAGVAKTADLTIEQVEELTELLKFRDTRTSLADQLEIAEIGGRQGFKAIDDLEAFVEAIDVANVALGDQFNNSAEETTTVLAGLRNVLTTFQTDNVGEDLLRIGNALNVLETQGVATAPVISDFVNRIAGLAIPLDVSTEQIFGLATTLDELQISAERGGTAVTKLLAELAARPEVFADFLIDQGVVQSTEEFVKLVQDDLLGALALVSSTATTAGETNTDFAAILEQIGIKGSRNLEVFAKLGEATETLEARTRTAAEALQVTDSLYAEFEKRNNTLGAAIDKLRNAFVNFVVRSDVQAGLKNFIDGITTLINAVSDLTGFLQRNRAVLLGLVAAIVAWNRAAIVASLQATIFGRALTALATAKGRAAIRARALTLAMRAIPAIAIGTAIFAVVKGLQALSTSSDSAAKATKRLSDAQQRIADEAAREQGELNRLIEVVKDSSRSVDERREALEELQSIYPDYFSNFDIEKGNVEELTALQDELNQSILESVAAREKARQLDELYGDILEKQLRINQLQQQGGAALSFTENFAAGLAGEDDATAVERIIQRLTDEIELLQEETQQVEAQFSDLFNTDAPGSPLDGALDGTTTAVGGLGDEADNTLSSLDALRERQSLLTKEIQNAILSGEPYGDQLRELRALQARLNRVQETYNSLLKEEQEETVGSLAGLVARRRELERQLDLQQDDEQIRSVSAQIAEVDEQIRQRELQVTRVIAEFNAATNTGNLSSLRNVIRDLDQQIQNTRNEAELFELIELRNGLEEQVEELEARISAASLQVEQAAIVSGDPDAILARRRELDAQLLEIDAQRKEEELQNTFEQIEIERNARALAVLETVGNEEQAAALIEQIETDARIARLDAEIAQAEIGSARYLELVRERAEIEKEIEKGKRDEIEEEEEAMRERLKATGLRIARELADGFFSAERQRIDDVLDRNIDRINDQYDTEISQAEGNTERIKQLEEERAEKIAELELEAARRRKDIARKEALVQLALSLIEAAPDPLLIAEAAVLGAIQLAVIESTNFAEGGFTGRSFLPPDRTGHRPVGIVHEDEYVVPKKVLQTNEGARLVGRLENMRISRSGSRAPYDRYYQTGGFTSAVNIPVSAMAGTNTVVLEASPEFNRGMEEAVRKGSERGSEKGTVRASEMVEKRREKVEVLRNRQNRR